MAGEFKGDFTRDSFDARKHFSRVFLQQGRVLLDADWNEQAAIFLRMLRRASSKSGSVDFGFFLAAFKPAAGGSPITDFIIVPGSCYVDGILCSCDGKLVPFSTQDSLTNVSTISVSEWMPDDLPLQNNQYVAILSGSEAFDPKTGFELISQLNQTDPTKRSAQLNPAVTTLAVGDADSFAIQRLTTFLTQPDFPLGPDDIKSFIAKWTASGSKGLVYLDVWERHIAYFQDPTIREIALAGPDTATRAKVVAQVKVLDDANNAAAPRTPTAAWLKNQLQPYNRGWLAAQLKPPSDSSPMDPCMTHPSAHFRGAENQLYRVEIHNDTKSNAPSFKWSRENACVVFPIVSSNGSTFFLESLGRDSRFSLRSDDWVELLDDILILQGKPGQLYQVDTISLVDRSVTLKSATAAMPPGIQKNDPTHPHAFLRRWDQKIGTSDGIPLAEATATNGNWFDLENGIQIQFQPALGPSVVRNNQTAPPKNLYRTGDYWLIPARTVRNGVIDWPSTLDPANKITVAIALPPHGIEHHYLPLGRIEGDGAGAISVTQLITKLS